MCATEDEAWSWESKEAWLLLTLRHYWSNFSHSPFPHLPRDRVKQETDSNTFNSEEIYVTFITQIKKKKTAVRNKHAVYQIQEKY